MVLCVLRICLGYGPRAVEARGMVPYNPGQPTLDVNVLTVRVYIPPGGPNGAIPGLAFHVSMANAV